VPDRAHVDDDFEWIIYVRISDDREGKGLGVERQAGDARNLVQSLGGKVLTVCSDNDMTATVKSKKYKKRPEYDRMCNLLQAKPGKRGVITWHPDRLHRDMGELEHFIKVVEEAKAQVATVKAGRIDVSTSSGRAVARTLCAWAMYESEHKSERIKSKVDELAKAGAIYGGGPRPFGYDRIFAGEGSRRKIVTDRVNPEEAEVIKEMAKRLLAGDSLRSVTRWLNAAGIRSSTGRLWSQQAVRIMMHSGRIAGLREHRREVIGKAVWDPIIAVEDHIQLRALLDSNQRPPGSRVRIHYLTGSVYCSDCAAERVKMQVGTQHGKLKYKCPPVTGCNGRVIPLADLEQYIGEIMIKKCSDPKTLRELAEREADSKSEKALLVDKIESDRRRLQLLQAELDDGDEEEIPEIAISIRKLRKRIRESNERLDAFSTVSTMIGGLTLPEVAERWYDLDMDSKQTVVRMFINRILIHPAVRGRSFFDDSRVQIEPVRKIGA
jgi:site-specific DNA recombinase